MQSLVPRQSQLFNAVCVDAAVVNGSSKNPLCNGTFVRCNVPSGECNASRGIFKGPGNKFLYYWRDIERWVIGDDYTSPKGWVCSVGCTTSCPTQVSSWKEWDTTTREFYIEPAITVHRSVECASSVVVSGDLTYPTCEGTYTRSNILPNANHAGRVILKGPGSKHIFYWSAISKWIIGDDYNLLKGWYCSNHTEGFCPTHVSGWKEWDPSIGRFEVADRVRVQQEDVFSDRCHDSKPSLGVNEVQDGTLVQVATEIVNDRSSPANDVHFEESFQSFKERMPPPAYWQLVGSSNFAESGEERELRIKEQRQYFQQRMSNIRRLITQPNFLQRMQPSSSAVMPF